MAYNASYYTQNFLTTYSTLFIYFKVGIHQIFYVWLTLGFFYEPLQGMHCVKNCNKILSLKSGGK